MLKNSGVVIEEGRKRCLNTNRFQNEAGRRREIDVLKRHLIRLKL
jgi:hypothetical protein